MSWYNPFSWFKSKPSSTIEIPAEMLFNQPKPYRKPSDTTKITKQMYDFILEMKQRQEIHNSFLDKSKLEKYETTEDLCSYLNMVFNTNFSRSKLTQVWTGKLNRDELPDGPEITIPF